MNIGFGMIFAGESPGRGRKEPDKVKKGRHGEVPALI